MSRKVIDISGNSLTGHNRKLLTADERKHLEGIVSINFSQRELKLLGINREQLAAKMGEVAARATHAAALRLRDPEYVKNLSIQDLTVIASHATQRMQELEAASGSKQDHIDWSKIDMSKFDQTQSKQQ
jgi:hypothetical protein